MQHTVPQRGLEYECLLHSLLALSSLDLATTTAQAGGSNSTRSAAAYTRAAMEYYGKSIALFRREVSDITYANHDSLYLISVLMSLINIAALHFPREDAGGGAAATLPSVLESMPTIFSLLRGATLVGVRCGRWLVDSVESVRIIVAMGAAPQELLDGGTREALARLGAVNDGLHISAVCRRAGQATEDETRAHEIADGVAWEEGLVGDFHRDRIDLGDIGKVETVAVYPSSGLPRGGIVGSAAGGYYPSKWQKWLRDIVRDDIFPGHI
ncbi:hypothetical protein MPH_09820 [Macrophomina phaseolina MS6]|uniref:Uncharacterized protein n=1 Tax=Macrophomina phaseolina (strain MS6) TaxID=1126212 RepID=K2S811_MACPH|nr:hypothetical protein MPH_09820 [Macrophomina phaseolina MS6]